MTARNLVSMIAFGIGHLCLVILLAGAELGIARAARDLPNRNPLALRIVRGAGDVLMLPVSPVLWIWRSERFSSSTDVIWLVSPLWGIALTRLRLAKQRRD
jgi:hypothetical protein